MTRSSRYVLPGLTHMTASAESTWRSLPSAAAHLGLQPDREELLELLELEQWERMGGVEGWRQ